MRNVVDLMFVQANAFDEIDLNFIARGEAAQKLGAGFIHLLGDGEDRRDVVTRMRVISRQKRIMEVEFPNRCPVGPGRPFRMKALLVRHTEDRGTICPGVRDRLSSGTCDRMAVDRRNRDRGVINDAIDHHIGDSIAHRNRVGGDFRYFPGELIFFGGGVFRRINFDGMIWQWLGPFLRVA